MVEGYLAADKSPLIVYRIKDEHTLGRACASDLALRSTRW